MGSIPLIYLTVIEIANWIQNYDVIEDYTLVFTACKTWLLAALVSPEVEDVPSLCVRVRRGQYDVPTGLTSFSNEQIPPSSQDVH